MMPDTFWDRMNTINASDEERDDSVLARFHTWRVGLAMGQDHPILGVGFHSYEFAYDRYDFLEGEFGYGRASHSTWFGTLGDLGFVGLGLFVIMLLQTFHVSQRLRRTPKELPHSAEIRTYATALQASMVPVVVGGTFLHLQYIEMLWHFFALTIALESIAVRTAADSQDLAIPNPVTIANMPVSRAALLDSRHWRHVRVTPSHRDDRHQGGRTLSKPFLSRC